MSLGKGVIRGYDAVTGLATVEIVGGHAYYVQVPAATHLSAAHLVDGRRCAVLFFDDQNPRDGVIVAAYDAVAVGVTVSAHATTHQNAGADEVSVAGLSGVLADGQNAAKIQGKDVDSAAPATSDVLLFSEAQDKWLHPSGFMYFAPASHSSSHEASGYDEIVVTGLTGELADAQKVKDHDHSGDAGDGGAFDAANLTSGAASDGDVLTADGSGGAAWEAAAAAGGGYTEGARVYNNADISLTNATWTVLTYNSENYDTDDCHSTGSNTSRLTVNTTGTYLIMATVTFASNASGLRILLLRVDGTTYIANEERVPVTGDTTVIVVGTIYHLTAGQYVEVMAYQSRGGALNVQYAAAYTPSFMMQRIG